MCLLPTAVTAHQAIEKFGSRQDSGEVHISFGELFDRYADISDTLVGLHAHVHGLSQCTFASEHCPLGYRTLHSALTAHLLSPRCIDGLCCVHSAAQVGILMRGKRRKRILYDSDMLFQGVHDHVVIRLMPA